MPEPRQRYFTNTGAPAAGCKLYTYAAGTVIPKKTYTDSAGTAEHENPITLDAKGECLVYFSGAYKIDLKTAAGVQVTGYPVDNYNTDPAGIWNIVTDFAASAGASLIGFIHTIAGAVARTVRSKLLETVSIQDVGGTDDWNGATGTNNFTAFENLCAQGPIRIRLPKTNTGVYMLSGATAITNTDNVILDADDGVSIYIQGSGRTPVSISGIRSTRFLDVYHETLRYSQPLGNQMYVKPSEKPAFMTAGDGELHKPISINFTTDAYSVKLASWPNGALARYTPTSTTATEVVHPAPGGIFAGTLVAVAPGDQIYARISSSANYPSVLIQTESGWMVVWAEIGASGLNTMELQSGSGVGLATDQPVLLNSAYNLDKSMVGVFVHDERNFSLIVSGTLIKRYTTFYNIVAAGWSGGFGAVPFPISDPIIIRNKKAIGVKPLKWVTIGDSISADTTTLRSHFKLAAQYLTGMGGFQIDTITNLAVAGETSGQQMTRLLATTITNYDYCLIQIGVNDIQTATAVATFVANIAAMVAYCRANQVVPIVGLPTMWYSQTSAQVYDQDGSATGNENANIGASYRLALLRKLSDLDVHVNMMVIEDEGAVIASLLTLAGADPVLSDNIHPTVYGSMLMGYSWAKAVAAHIAGGATDLVASTFMDHAWFTNPVNPATVPSYTTSGGFFDQSGFLSKGASAWADGDVLGTLPKRFWPANTRVHPVKCFDAGVLGLAGAPWINVDNAGIIRIYGVPATTAFVAFSGNWRI